MCNHFLSVPRLAQVCENLFSIPPNPVRAHRHPITATLHLADCNRNSIVHEGSLQWFTCVLNAIKFPSEVDLWLSSFEFFGQGVDLVAATAAAATSYRVFGLKFCCHYR
ncbi:hypothetical protein TcasGA2_TC014057 [Tribolium castaneum]|uniref:Uncharacterized protein n=1 Tax=Tribolium castaneum TaxID=7070 RepID=D6WJZ1_TRICA|nr:hypothetical protein TcasGA2_TC014057 [Tribolium castaneum]